MRRLLPLLLLALLALAGAALAQSVRSISTNQRATYQNAVDGGLTVHAQDFGLHVGRAIDLGNVCGYRVSVCAGESDTRVVSTQLGMAVLTAGTLKPYVLPPDGGRPMQNSDLNLTVGAPGGPCRLFPDQQVSVPQGWRMLYATSGMTGTAWDAGSLNSDGGSYVVRIDAWTCQ